MTTTDPDEIRTQIEHTRANLSEDVNALADEIRPGAIVHRQTRKVTGVFGSAKERVMGTASDVQDGAAAAPTQVRERTQGNPLAAGLVAFGVGLVAAALMPVTDKERDAAARIKDEAQPLTDQVKDMAQESAQNLKEPARQAVDSVKQTASEGAANVKDETQSAAVDVRQGAADAKDAVQESR